MREQIKKIIEPFRRRPIFSTASGLVSVAGVWDFGVDSINAGLGTKLPSFPELLGSKLVSGSHLLPWWAWITLAQVFATIWVGLISRDAIAALNAGLGPERLKAIEREVEGMKQIASAVPRRERLVRRLEAFSAVQERVERAWGNFNAMAQDPNITRAIQTNRFGWGEMMDAWRRAAMEVSTAAKHAFGEDVGPGLLPNFNPHIPALGEPTHDLEKQAGYRQIYGEYLSVKSQEKRIIERFNAEISNLEQELADELRVEFW